jgi:hypothetical protein
MPCRQSVGQSSQRVYTGLGSSVRGVGLAVSTTRERLLTGRSHSESDRHILLYIYLDKKEKLLLRI